MSKHILIIGGMGPQASLHAHQRILELLPHSNSLTNEDYPRITHLSVNVKDFISDQGNKDEAENYLLQCLDDINMETVDVGFIACNTAHLLFDSVQKEAQGKLVSMIAVTNNKIAQPKTGIVATPSTIRQHLYGDNIDIIPDDKSLVVIESIIRKVISGTPVSELVSDLKTEINKLIDRGAEKVVLGCSELSIFGRYLDSSIIIDPIDITIDKILNSY